MTSSERRWALISAIKYLNRAGVEGAIVECGVWRGGNMLIAKDLCNEEKANRKVYLFDTFTGMSEPTDHDVSSLGDVALDEYRARQRDGDYNWALASLEEVRQNFERAGLLDDNVIFVKGKVEYTLLEPANVPDQIALLRLDTDWYESTRIELETLFPRLASGGVLIIDDYGHWEGARRAVDEYFMPRPVLLVRIDRTGRLVIKN
jgi:hypothetical protein